MVASFDPVSLHETRITVLEKEQAHFKEWETKQNGSLQRMADDLADLRKDTAKDMADLRDHLTKEINEFGKEFKQEMRDYRSAVTKAQWTLIATLGLIVLDLARSFLT